MCSQSLDLDYEYRYQMTQVRIEELVKKNKICADCLQNSRLEIKFASELPDQPLVETAVD